MPYSGHVPSISHRPSRAARLRSGLPSESPIILEQEGDAVKKELESTPQAARLESWIVDARSGSRAALDHLFSTYRPYLLAAARQDLGAELRTRIDAADVVQDTLIEACRDFPHFRGRTEKDLLAWLRQILHNNLCNERRRHIRTAMRSVCCEVSLEEVAAEQMRNAARGAAQSPSAQAQAREENEALEQALRRLPDHYRKALLLHTWEEMTFAQIGEHLHCSAEAARKLWGRAAEQLIAVLRDRD